MAEHGARLRAMGGVYTPGRDKVLDELVVKLGTSPKRGGSGFNPQRIRNLRGADGIDRLVYVDSPDDAHFLNIDGSPGEKLSERDKQALEYDRLENNRRTADFVAKYGREAAIAAGLRIIPDPNDDTPASGIQPRTSPAPAPQSAAPESAPAEPTGIQPRTPSAPAPATPTYIQPRAARPPAIPAGIPEKTRPYGEPPRGVRSITARPRRARGGGSSSTAPAPAGQPDKYVDGDIRRGIREVDALQRRGDYAGARKRANELLTSPGTRPHVEVIENGDGTITVQRKGKQPLQGQGVGTAGGRVGPRAHASVNREEPDAAEQDEDGPISEAAPPDESPTITRAQFRRYAATYGLKGSEALQALKEQGYTLV